MVETVAFFLFSLLVVVAAWRVVASKDVVRAALALVVVLAGMAPLYIMLAAEFVAVVQVLVYVGAVVVLFLFAIMLTRSPAGNDTQDVDHPLRWPAALVAIGLFAVLIVAIRSSVGTQLVEPTEIGRTAAVGESLLREYVIPFEVVSVLLLVALIGAITLARRD